MGEKKRKEGMATHSNILAWKSHGQGDTTFHGVAKELGFKKMLSIFFAK